MDTVEDERLLIVGTYAALHSQVVLVGLFVAVARFDVGLRRIRNQLYFVSKSGGKDLRSKETHSLGRRILRRFRISIAHSRRKWSCRINSGR